jgi:predicted ATP-binding protein involved in virulence
LKIAFDPSFAILLGGNMAGKTAVLEGAAAALSVFLEHSQGLQVVTDDEVFQVVADINGVPDLQKQYPVTVVASVILELAGQDRVIWGLTRSDASTCLLLRSTGRSGTGTRALLPKIPEA